MTDDLTGLANRRALATALTAVSFGDAAPTRTDRARPRQGLLLLALNQFEEINDSLGRHVGDELLRHIAGRLSESLRPEDLLFRTGGDEFAVLFADRVDLTTVRAQAGYLVETLLAPFDLDPDHRASRRRRRNSAVPRPLRRSPAVAQPRGGGGVARQGRRQQDRGVRRGGGDTKR